jgi:hypothetical protein
MDDVLVFYSCPANASKYNDTEGILTHFKFALDFYKCFENSWEWVFDFKGFELKHMMEIRTAIGISEIINNYSKYLTKIRIINMNCYTHSMMKIVTPFLNESIKNKIDLIK